MIFHDVPLACINQAAVMYHVPAAMIISVMMVENGRNGMARPNKNGTYDLGVLQINTIWLPKLKKYGITQEQLQYNPCVNVQTATWILAQNIAKSAGWQGIGHYHSATPLYNKRYREKVKIAYDNIHRVLRGQIT